MLILALAIVMAAAFLWILHEQSTSASVQLAHYEHALDQERERNASLIIQMQANAQGFQHYPTYGPAPAYEEPNIIRDDTGLIEYEMTSEDLADFADVGDS